MGFWIYDTAHTGIASFIVTRYDKYMKKPEQKRGRPRKANPMTAAERMRAYRQRKKAAGLKNVRHWESEDYPFEGRYSDHQILDARSLALHCAIARKITRDAAMLQIAKDNLERWAKKAGRHPPKYLQEWQTILERPWPEIAHFICSMSDDAIRLRSSSPFAGILSDEERERVYAAFRA